MEETTGGVFVSLILLENGEIAVSTPKTGQVVYVLCEENSRKILDRLSCALRYFKARLDEQEAAAKTAS